MTDTVRVYVNGVGSDTPQGAGVVDALERINPAEAASVRAGETLVTDSRGLPVEPDTVVYNGAIFRTIRARSRENIQT